MKAITETETKVAAPKAPKTEKKAIAKKATPKASAKKAPKKEKTPSGEQGVERSHDLPWNEKKVAVFKAMKALKAIGAGNARSAKDIAEKSGVPTNKVRHYVYHARVSKLTDVAVVEDIRGYAYYLTAAGAKINPDAELKAQQAAKKG